MTRPARPFRPRRGPFHRWLRKVWWVQPPFQYPVRWWHSLDRVFCWFLTGILVVHSVLGPILDILINYCN